MFRRCFSFALTLTLLGSMVSPFAARAAVAPSSYAALHWRFIGPLRGGRTKAVAGVASQPNRFYVAQVNGGIWRTDNAGRTWTPIFDREPTGSIGSLAVAPSDPNVIYAGSGEGLQRPDLSVGNGIYKSTDAGATWTHLGLRDGEQLPMIAVDPNNANRLFVAVLGHPYGPNDERGVYRSLDGGATFTRVLFHDRNTGAFDVKIDAQHPDTVYATLWAARQAPWEIGGSFETAQSGLYKSTDGGTTWSPLTNGLPARIGRASLSVAPSNGDIVYAIVDAPSGCAVYRSDDAGAHFVRTNNDANVCERGDDLTTITADPVDAHTVYITNTSTYRSTDDGVHFTAIKGAPGGDDYQNAWINPLHPEILLLGSDQGATISLDHGKTWSSWYNQPTAQMYHVSADNRFPYWVCSGQQESGSACVKSRGDWGEITERDWHPVGAEEYGYVAPDPLHPGVFFGGKVERFDEATGQTQEVAPRPLRGPGYRVVRTQPLTFDPLDPHTLYFAANTVFATRDDGKHWRSLSPDLTRVHPGVPAVLGPFASDDPEKGAHRGVIYALAPSYTHHGTLWAGTDDGLVWITHDTGAHWSNITPTALTPWSKVSQIDASHFDDRSAYVSVNRFRLDDLRPHVYRTHDSGAHWTNITSGLPDAPVNAVRADPRVPGLLYAATENGVFVSFNDGAQWQSLQNDLPHTSVRDIIVHGNDLLIGTHGRGFWILDNIEPLREFATSSTFLRPHLFAPSLAYRIRRSTNTDTPLPPEEPSGENPPDGAILDYLLPANASHVAITILDSAHRVVRRFTSDDQAPSPVIGLDKPVYWIRPFRAPSTEAGMHRFIWDEREPTPHSITRDLPISAVDMDTPYIPQGALVIPGRYTVQLNVDGATVEKPITVALDPRVSLSRAQLAENYTVTHETSSLLDRTFTAMTQARTRHDAVHATRFSMLNGRLNALSAIVDGADAPITEGTRDAFCALRRETLQALEAPVTPEAACAQR